MHTLTFIYTDLHTYIHTNKYTYKRANIRTHKRAHTHIYIFLPVCEALPG